MTQGFYEQIGVRSDAELDEVKAAYARAVAHLLRRREATVAQGGDPRNLDLIRTQLDEAWEVLSDPARRRRYDAMLAVAGDGALDADLDDLWSRVAGAMIHPGVSAAARIVDATTGLGLAPLPEPPRPSPGRRSASAPFLESLGEGPGTTPTRVPTGVSTGVSVGSTSGPARPAPRPTLAQATAALRGTFGSPRQVERGPEGSDATAPRPVERPAATARVRPVATSPTGVPAAVPLVSEPPSQAGAPVPGGTQVGPASAPPSPPAGPQVRVAAAPATASVSLAPPSPPAEPPAPADPAAALEAQHGHGGALLRAARELRGLTLQQLSETTRINARYLEALEREDFDALPSGPTFVRGYVREVARILGLDTDAVVGGYMRRFRGDA